ncbi:TIGR03032 family protein [Ancylothrix sp. C2]|uniref:TIGR03032 family protein n=1 Tax=Ancylothrix sp. D3o TaxID=2953691 RepID=UPI0021BB2D49|nr:TIGR03032 family protein [Ancylothrix sp. D3o]MCT7951104.1 TIGR03032 family protein [Ancylothrix sp. D3o]
MTNLSPLTENITSNSSLEITGSPDICNWLLQEEISLAFSTYQSNSLFFVSGKADGKLAIHRRFFDKPMGMFLTENQLYLSTRYQLWQFRNVVGNGEFYNNTYDKAYFPQSGHITGELNIHDVVVINPTICRGNPPVVAPNEPQQIIFVNTLFSCLATLDNEHNFNPLWKPPFISKLVAEDRCHLNGLAVVENQPRYVTAIGTCDQASNWREKRDSGGVVIDITTDEIISAGLSMPHSPRFYENKLWVLNSGTGNFGFCDLETGKYQPVAFCPGFVRGLAFHKNYAIVGLSKVRDGRLSGLQLEKHLSNNGGLCGLMVVDINTGAILHWLKLEGEVTEIYDVAVLAGVKRPAILSADSEEIQRIVTFPGGGGLVVTKPGVNVSPTALPSHTSKAMDGGESQVKNTPSPSDQAIASYPNGGAIAVKYQMVHNLTVESSCDYDALTFPRIKKRWQSRQLQGELLGVSASVSQKIVGFLIAEIFPDVKSANLISFYVLPEFRNQKIGSSLLFYLEKDLKKKGFTTLEVSYQQTEITGLALEAMLRKFNWQPPETKFLLCKTTTEKIAAAPWLYKPILPTEYEIFPWQELSQIETQKIRQWQDCPAALNPFTNDTRIEFMNSLGVRHKGEIIGWSLTHRVAPDTIRYSSLFVREKYQKLGRAVPVLAESIKRQIASPVPYCTFSVAKENGRMLEFVKRRLQPYLTYFSESRWAVKLLEGG